MERTTRWLWAGAGMGSVAVVMAWLPYMLANGLFAIDFGVFHAGGTLIRTEGYAAAYDVDSFEAMLEENYFPSLASRSTITHFISTPNFAFLTQGLSFVPFRVALGLWLAAGVGAIACSLKLLRVRLHWLPVVLLTPWALSNVILGQTGAFALLAVALAQRFESDRHPFAAGAIVGLLAIKPTLLVGIGALWLLRPRAHVRQIGMAAVVLVVGLIPTVLGGLASWRAFGDSTTYRLGEESDWSQPSVGVYEFGKVLLPGAGAVSTYAWMALAVVTTFAGAEFAHRRWPDRPDVRMAAAVVLGVWGSPYLLMYDALILVVPLAVAGGLGALDARRGGILAALLALPLGFGPLAMKVQFDIAGRGILVETVGFVVAMALLLRWVNQALASAEATGRDSGDQQMPELVGLDAQS